MKLKTMGLTLIMVGTALAFGTGCMDETPSILLNGSFVVQGSITQGGTEAEPTVTLNCSELPTDVVGGSTWSKGQINIADLKRCGQACDVDGVVGQGGNPNTFMFVAGMMNKLPDSRSVGGRGNTGNNYLDQNNVWVREAIVRFPADLNTWFHEGREFTFPEVEWSRLTSAYLQSGGGVKSMNIAVIDSANELAAIEGFLREVIQIRDRPVTFIAEIQVMGKSDAGTDIESNRFHFPIDICVNCEVPTTPICTAEAG